VEILSASAVLSGGHGFLESPRWHDDRLFVSDMALGNVLAISMDGTVEPVCSVPGGPSGLGWLSDGRLLVVSMHHRQVMCWDGKDLSLHADLTGVVAHDLNDMVVDTSGRAYVTNFGYDGAPGSEPVTTGLVLVDVDGSVEMQDLALFRPNGLVISPDGATLVVAETRVHRLTAASIDDMGRLSSQREFATLPRGGWCDGITADREGGVWVADPKAKACRRVLAGGEVTHVIDTTPDAAIACMLGGATGRTLFLLVTPGLSFEAARQTPSARVLTIEVDVEHAGLP
jgi:sugar lactone lactonase YvrE